MLKSVPFSVFGFRFSVQTAKGAKIFSAAVAATVDGHRHSKDEDKIKMHTHSYCCLDYAQVCFVCILQTLILIDFVNKDGYIS